MKRHFSVRAALCAVLLLALSRPASAQSTLSAMPALASDPAFQSAVEQARLLDDPEHGRFEHWRQASELAGNQSTECLHQLVSGYFAVHRWSEAATAAERLDAVATETREKFYADASAGKALLHNPDGSEKPPTEQLIRAEGYIRKASALQPRALQMIFIEGKILASLGREPEAKAQFEQYVSLARENYRNLSEVKVYIDNPHAAALYAGGGTTAQAGAGTSLLEMSQAAPEPAYKSDPKFQKAFAAAHERVDQEERLARWKKASKLADNQCIECLRTIVSLQLSAGQWKDAVTTSNLMDSVATEKKDKFFAASQRGEALMHSDSGQVKPEQARLAEASFHSALEISPRTKNLVFKEGRALALLGRDAEAKAMFERYLALAGEADPYRVRAEHFVENPHLASFPMAPPFTVTTAEGEQISLDEQVGKVVLLDFWATWCGPCKETLPEIHSIAKKFAGQPLVVVSISSDSNDIAWKEFVASHDMFWAQYRDANHALSNAYGVSAIPRFFTIDSDGVLQSIKVGSGADIEGDLKKLVKRASEAERKKTATTDKTGAE